MPRATVKLGFEVPRELNDQLNEVIPDGMKNQVIRALLARALEDLKKPTGLYELLHWKPEEKHG